MMLRVVRIGVTAWRVPAMMAVKPLLASLEATNEAQNVISRSSSAEIFILHRREAHLIYL